MLDDLTIIDSPSWNIGLRGNNIVVSHITVSAGADKCGGYASAPNTDGVNVGGTNIDVYAIVVHNGDDCIPVTAGPQGFTDNVRVHDVHCQCGTNGGVIYNEGGAVRNVLFIDMTVASTNQGVGMWLCISLTWIAVCMYIPTWTCACCCHIVAFVVHMRLDVVMLCLRPVRVDVLRCCAAAAFAHPQALG